MAFTRRSIANGRIALFRGIWESLSLVKQTRADVETALALDPENDVANYILGRVHAKVTEKPRILRWPLGLGWANTEDAIKYFEKAISLKQEFIMYRLDCARAYVDDDNYEMARKHLEAIDRIGNKDEDDERFRKEAAELLEEIREQ
jgi:tetratricopeptide (TPR) repeat protein